MSAADGITGLHHITVIAGDAQENLDFYTGVMGMRLVKKTVNQDVPGTYHLFYADAVAHPGTDLTFFPWPDMAPGVVGVGLTVEVTLAVPTGSLQFWAGRLEQHGIQVGQPAVRFGERLLTFADPHGLALALVETAEPREFTPWAASSVPGSSQVRGLHGVRLLERSMAPTADFLTRTLGFEEIGEEHGWHRFVLDGSRSGRVLDIREAPTGRPGTWGTGSVHHIAWRVPDDATELEVQRRLYDSGRRPTPVIDRFWFKSVYFREPGGALFEIATDGPGFGADEAMEQLGSRLVLPPWLEPRRADIESSLPPLRNPEPAAQGSNR
ncbi:MAG TPA: ring-cleaving dioxygenase [Gemmatimonadales bacterium]|nr:ring-cleaving dioxygenase [Gemmatimonadales bacterium]